MELEDFVRAFEDAIREAVAETGVKLDKDVAANLSGIAGRAGHDISSQTPSELYEDAIEAGSAFYKKIVRELAKMAKMFQIFPKVDKNVMDSVLGATGPNPPFYYR